MNFKENIILLCLILLTISGNAQSVDSTVLRDRYFRILFYNVENLFDVDDDTLTNDNEFLPGEAKYWTYGRYLEKLHHISTVIVSAGGWQPPEIVGLCEIENQKVLEDLCYKTGLQKFGYSIIHKESNDPRGIDVALLYRKQYFKPISYNAITIEFPFSPGSRTRDILYVKGLLKNNDTLNFFINHWPSRWGGQLESEQFRIQAAKTLREKIDSIYNIDYKAKIIIVGDFNDYPENHSIKEILKARDEFITVKDEELYNLTAYTGKSTNAGSHKHNGIWGILDQIIVSGTLLNAKKGLSTLKENAFIFNASFLLVDDESFTGKTTFRTYNGYKYIGGYSDHLPVIIDLDNNK